MIRQNPSIEVLQPLQLGIVLKANQELIALVSEGDIRAFRVGSIDLRDRIITQDPEGRRVELEIIVSR